LINLQTTHKKFDKKICDASMDKAREREANYCLNLVST